MMTLIQQVSTMPEFVSDLKAVAEFLTDSRRELPGAADNAGELIAEVYLYSGADDTTATNRGNEIHQKILTLDDAMARMGVILNEVRRMTRTAVQAMDDADARRNSAAGRLKI
jgi:hypothetical protein